MFSKKITVTGMTCGHCEARVEKAVAAIPGIKSVKADHKKSAVSYKGDVDEETVKSAIRDAGYEPQ